MRSINDKNTVSIIIPCFNAKKSVIRAVRSALKQTYKSVEVIVVDDGSVDGSFEELRNNFTDCENVIIKRKVNEGVGRARNDGIKLATGEYIYFLDADDYLQPEAIAEMIFAINENNADIAISGYKYVCGKTKLTVEPCLIEGITPIENFILDKIVSSPWAKLFRADIINRESISFSTHKIMQDGFFNTHYFCYVNNVAVVNSPLYIYDKGLSTSTKVLSQEKLNLILGAMAEQEAIVNKYSNIKRERITSLYQIRRLRLAALFPLQAGCYDPIIREELRKLDKVGVFRLEDVRFHEKILAKSFMLGNQFFHIANLLLTLLRKLKR